MSLAHLPNCEFGVPKRGMKQQGRQWLTKERCEGLGRLEEFAGGDAVVVVGLDVDVIERLVERIEPGPA